MTKILDILKTENTGHGLTVFEENEIQTLEKSIFEKKGKPYIKCFVSGIDRPLKPEEIVRQLFARKLVTNYHYPLERLDVEKSVYFGGGYMKKEQTL